MSDDAPQSGGAAEDQAASQGNGRTSGARNIRSTIAFPYGSLKDAEHVAQALHETWGGSASPEQLAGGMGSSPKSGAFRLKTATARTFGVVETSRGQIALTSLGRQIVDPQTRAAARVKAFLDVPLFGQLFKEYNGATLPPDTGLEQKILDFGVSKKQTAKARQAFQRSAEHAGFFKHGRNRLVQPPADMQDSDGPSGHEEDGGSVTPPTAGHVPVPVQQLWLTLLNDGRSWSPEKTHEFVDAARKLHELLAAKPKS